MTEVRLDVVAQEQRERAAASGNGRSAETVHGGSDQALRQTVVALKAGVELSEHENPGEATVLVLSGQVELRSGDTTCRGGEWALLVVPAGRHSLHALEDSAVLLTVAKTGAASA